MSDTAMQQIEAYTVKEAAYILGVDHKTVYGWISSGKIKSIRIVGAIRIEPEEIGKILHTPIPADS